MSVWAWFCWCFPPAVLPLTRSERCHLEKTPSGWFDVFTAAPPSCSESETFPESLFCLARSPPAGDPVLKGIKSYHANLSVTPGTMLGIILRYLWLRPLFTFHTCVCWRSCEVWAGPLRSSWGFAARVGGVWGFLMSLKRNCWCACVRARFSQTSDESQPFTRHDSGILTVNLLFLLRFPCLLSTVNPSVGKRCFLINFYCFIFINLGGSTVFMASWHKIISFSLDTVNKWNQTWLPLLILSFFLIPKKQTPSSDCSNVLTGVTQIDFYCENL